MTIKLTQAVDGSFNLKMDGKAVAELTYAVICAKVQCEMDLKTFKDNKDIVASETASYNNICEILRQLRSATAER